MGQTRVPGTQIADGASGVNLTVDVTGTLPVANGGTGVTTITGSGDGVHATLPTLITPVLGVATATSINKTAITAPTTSATLAIANLGTLATSGAFSITLTATATTNVTLPTTGTIATQAGTETFSGKSISGITNTITNLGPNSLATGASTLLTTGSSTTTNTAYALLADAVSTSAAAVIGSKGIALVGISSYISNAGAGGVSYVGFAISGATTVAATDTQCIEFQAFSGGAEGVYGNVFLVTGLTAGTNTFTMQYKVGTSQTGTFKNRRIAVVPL